MTFLSKRSPWCGFILISQLLWTEYAFYVWPQNDKRRRNKLGFRISIQSGTRHSCCEMSLAEEIGKQEMCVVQKKKERKEEGRICCRRVDRERPCRLSTCRRSAPLLPVLTPSKPHSPGSGCLSAWLTDLRLRSPPTDFFELVFLHGFFCRILH